MLGDTVGFVILKSDADCSKAVGDSKTWTKGIKMALEINHQTDSILLIQDAQMGMFDFKDVDRKFECQRQGDVLMPMGLNEMEKIMYFGYVMSRNGGYSDIAMKMVIAASLHREEFCDSVLWQKGQDPITVEAIRHLQNKGKERFESKTKK
jgi:hypothetical protein